MNDIKRNIYGFDLFKFIMAILIVMTHSDFANYFNSPFSGYIYSFEGLAVPLFFIYSSYLFFEKYRKSSSKLSLCWKYVYRVLILYFVWILLVGINPLINKGYFNGNIFWGLTNIIIDVLFRSIFMGSWFLGAMIVGIPIICVSSKIIKDKFIWIIPLTILLYIEEIKFLPHSLQYFYHLYNDNVQPVLLSFWKGLIWLTIGYLITNPTIKKHLYSFKKRYYLILFIIFFPLYIHFHIVIPIVVLPLFVISYKINLPTKIVSIPISNTLWLRLRKYSIMIYCTHGCILHLIRRIGDFNPLYRFMITFTVCLIISTIIYELSNTKAFKFLKYAM